jgi:hypothetical protein
MTSIPRTQATSGVATYLGRGDPAGRFADYSPRGWTTWPATSPWRGRCWTATCGARTPFAPSSAASASCTTARTSTSPAPGGDNGFIEDYTAEVRGRPLGCFHLVTFNADGQAQHVAAHYRRLSSGMFFSRLLRESLAGTPYGEHFLAGEA